MEKLRAQQDNDRWGRLQLCDWRLNYVTDTLQEVDAQRVRLPFTETFSLWWVFNSSVPLPCNINTVPKFPEWRQNDISDNVYENFDFHTLGWKINRSRTATDWPLAGRNRRGRVRGRKMRGLVIVECGLRVLSVRQGYVQNCRVWTECWVWDRDMYRIVECGLRVRSVRQGYVQNCRVWTECWVWDRDMYRIVVCGLRVLSVRQGYVQNCRVWTESAECETGIRREL
jgi:hypothetical protein